MKTIGGVLLSLTCIGLITLAVSLLTNNSAEANNPLAVNTTGQPYTGQCSGSGNPTSTCVMNTLPSGMRLVIQAVSFSSRSASGANVYRAVIGTTVNGSGPRNLYLAL